MAKNTVSLLQFSRLRKAIANELLSGAERVRRTYREEVVRSTWNIGKILRQSLGFGNRPSPENAALIARLSKDFHRPDSFYYDAAKFNRLYPSRPLRALSLSHYSLLIRITDSRKRLALEKKALNEDISAKDLRMYTRLVPGLVSVGEKGAVLAVERGRLYHYRATNAPVDGTVMIDIGFGIEREIRCDQGGGFYSGLIIRAARDKENYSAKISPFDKSRLYTYAATLKRVIDGDTILARVDLGFRTWIIQAFRLRGIDAPEMTCALGQKAKAEVKFRLTLGASLVIKSYKQEKYGRFLADVFYKKGTEDREQILRMGAFLNQELLDKGLAVLYDEKV